MRTMKLMILMCVVELSLWISDHICAEINLGYSQAKGCFPEDLARRLEGTESQPGGFGSSTEVASSR